MPTSHATVPIHCRTVLHHVDGDDIVGVETEILDGRSASLSFDDAGFELRSMPSSVADWNDAAEVVASHHPEVADLARAMTDCEAVLFYPAIVRSPAHVAADPQLGPIEAVHSDYTEAYRSMLATADHPYVDILGPSMREAGVTADELVAATRVVTLQLWRNIGARRPDRPLAFCDARTVDRHELIEYRVESYGGVRTDFDSFLVAPPRPGRERRWYTFPAMAPEEVVVFRAFDSERAAAGEPFWTPHSAFVDPTAGPDAPARESVEIRAVCLFGV